MKQGMKQDVTSGPRPAPAPDPNASERTEKLTIVSNDATISDFQPDAIALEEKLPPKVARATLYLVAGLIAAALIWAILSRVDQIAVAPGKLVTTQPNLVVQPLERAVIRTIHVAIGDVVKAGQPLVTLDPTFTDADVSQLKSKIAGFDALLARLEAEVSGEPIPPSKTAANADELLQVRVLNQRKASFEAQLRNLDQAIARTEASLSTSRSEVVLNVQRLDTLKEIEEMRATLLDKQSGSRLNLLQSRDLRLDIETTIARARGTQIELAHGLEKARAERDSFIEDFRRTALEHLVEIRDQRKTAAEELKKAELRRDLVVLTAPADGVVLDIAQRSLGSVLREAEPLVTLVPMNVPLEAEVAVESKDIGHISVGQPVRVKFDAFPFQKHGTASGLVRTISQDAFSKEANEQRTKGALPFYRVRVSLTDITLRAIPDAVRILPGMAVNAEIKVGTRTVMSYFLYPLIKGLDEAIREP